MPLVQEIGRIGEDKAQAFLESKGYLTLKRNWHRHWAEIDIVMFDKKTGEVVFVEVKTLVEVHQLKPFEAVDHQKIDKLKRAAALFLAENPEWNGPVRIDVVSVELKTKQIEHFKALDFELSV